MYINLKEYIYNKNLDIMVVLLTCLKISNIDSVSLQLK